MDLDKGAGLKLDITKVPKALWHLVPFVERWGFESLEEQDAFVTEMLTQRPQEVQEFNLIVDEANPIISRWGNTLTELNKHISELTDADRAHPYWFFLNMLKIREITGYNNNDPELIAANKRFALEIRKGRCSDAIVKADEAFRIGDYAACINIIRPFEDLLSPLQKKKLEMAIRRMNGKHSTP